MDYYLPKPIRRRELDNALARTVPVNDRERTLTAGGASRIL
jgi:hypothetical protein